MGVGVGVRVEVRLEADVGVGVGFRSCSDLHAKVEIRVISSSAITAILVSLITRLPFS
jgi:hypothetical protein